MYVGEGEATLRDTFRRARLAAPAIIFLDEADALAPRRQEAGDDSSSGGGGPEAGLRLLSTLLTEIDGLEETQGGVTCVTCSRAAYHTCLMTCTLHDEVILDLNSLVCSLFCAVQVFYYWRPPTGQQPLTPPCCALVALTCCCMFLPLIWQAGWLYCSCTRVTCPWVMMWIWQHWQPAVRNAREQNWQDCAGEVWQCLAVLSSPWQMTSWPWPQATAARESS